MNHTTTNSCSMERLYAHFYVSANLMFARISSNAVGYCWLSLCTLCRDACCKRAKCGSL